MNNSLDTPTLVTAYTSSYRALAEVTVPRMRQYALRWGMQLDVVSLRVSAAPIWEKLSSMLRAGTTSSVVWLDVDCYITDLEFDLTTSYPLRTAFDGDGLCGCILSVGAKEGWELLSSVWFLKDVQGGIKQDQSTLKHLIAHFPKVRAMVVSDIPVSDPVETRQAPVYHGWASARGYEQAVQEVKRHAQLAG